MEKEIWKPIKNYEGSYEVSNMGKVRSLDRYCIQKNNFSDKYNHIYRGKILNQYKNNAGYMQVSLCNRYKQFSKRVHRLVAEAFIPNPNNYKCVNHIDGNKLNNNVSNLEWCSYSHNNREARRLGLNKGYKGMTYKKRCELAIEKIESYRNILWTEYDEELLNILKGSDKE